MSSVLTSLIFYKKVFYKYDKVFAIYSCEFCSSIMLFYRIFRSLSMTSIQESIHQGHEAFSQALEADSVHLSCFQLCFSIDRILSILGHRNKSVISPLKFSLSYLQTNTLLTAAILNENP